MQFALEPLPVVVAVVTFLLAGLVKGVIGLGLPTIAMGLLSLIVPPAQAAALLIVPSFVTNIWQLAAGPALKGLLRRLWPMLAGVVLGTLASADVLQGEDARQALAALGIALVAYAALGLTAARFAVTPSGERWLGPVVGAATGLVSGMTGVFVIPAVPYLAALGLTRDELIQALGLSFTVSTIALAAVLFKGGAFEGATAAASVVVLAPALLGMMLGGWVRDRVSENVFRKCFFLALIALGGHLATRALL
jgi:uncharacterized protein